MSKIIFTEKEIIKLSKSKGLSSISPKSISYDKEFKVAVGTCKSMIQVKETFREWDIDVDIIGEKRVEQCWYRFKRQLDTGGDKIFEKEQRGRKGKNNIPDKGDSEAYIKYLERELELKNDQLGVLKKYIPAWDPINPSRDNICEGIYLYSLDNSGVSILNMCTSFGFIPQVYYKYLVKRKAKLLKIKEDLKIVKMINKVKKKQFGNVKGYRQITMDLNNNTKLVINHKKVLRIMKDYNLLSDIRKKNPYAGIAKENRDAITAPNLLDREFKFHIPFKKILSDITYLLPNNNLKFYLSAAKDLATGEIVAFNVRADMKLALSMDIITELDEKGITEYMFHSDQGVHYTSKVFSTYLTYKNITQSMSRRGKCTDNGPMESFFGHFKDEVDYSKVRSLEEMQKLVTEYVIYYNQQRGQWNRKKMSPVNYRKHLLSL